MNKIFAVIGANWGDEGKGLITDYLSEENTTVVRYNGGAQAGHTVVDEDRRHVFHHFGSGTLRGANTFLSKYFAVSPIFFKKERDELLYLGADPQVAIDPLAPVTTPYDIMLNQYSSKTRGHGTCGMGFNETLERQKVIRLCYYDLADRDRTRSILRQIRNEYVPLRMKVLGIEELPILAEHRTNQNIFERFAAECDYLFRQTEMVTWGDKLSDRIVFEGAQGLQLSSDSKNFPHVTRSLTGMTNICQMLADAGLPEHFEPYYVTRTYMTRHGAGPFPTETPETVFPKDKTNVYNQFQGTLRYGWLDVDLLVETIKADARVTPSIAITHADLGGTVRTGVASCMTVHELADTIMERTKAQHCLISYGPTRKDVRKYA